MYIVHTFQSMVLNSKMFILSLKFSDKSVFLPNINAKLLSFLVKTIDLGFIIKFNLFNSEMRFIQFTLFTIQVSVESFNRGVQLFYFEQILLILPWNLNYLIFQIIFNFSALFTLKLKFFKTFLIHFPSFFLSSFLNSRNCLLKFRP